MSEETSIYERIGGEEGIEGILDIFYDKVIADSVLKSYFHGASLPNIRKKQKEFFAAATGGPHAYIGRSLGEVHKNMGISRYEFDRFVKLLVESLKERGISDKDGREVVAKVNIYAEEITHDENFE